MKLRLARPAARQLDRVLDHVAQQHPTGARNVQMRIDAIMDLLLRQPPEGHATARSGIRRFVATPYPYAITDRVTGNDVVVLGTRHTSRRPIP